MRRTSLNLDMRLVTEAREELGTKNTTDTVHAALREVTRRAALKRLAEWDFSHLPPNWHELSEEDEHAKDWPE